MGPPTRQQELLALALHVEKEHGSNAPRYISERIVSSAMERAVEQIDFWKAVAAEFQSISKASPKTN